MTFSQRLQRETEADRNAFLGIELFRDLMQKAPFDLNTYIQFLVCAYQHVRWTTPLYGLVLSRMIDAPLAQRKAICLYIQEELGHEHWIENDLNSLGVDLANCEVPEAATIFVDYLKDIAANSKALTLLGMSFVLENHSVSFGPLTVALLKEQHQLPNKALTYLQSHGELDVHHIKEQNAVLDSITDPETQDAIIQCAKKTFQLYGDIFRSLQAQRMECKP
ncbi:MAG: iron-containing redox enzyme family protein [Planctomycetota bacterium]|nr:iron-containing redox enzyme family protein [Planctomycetota bacterium]